MPGKKEPGRFTISLNLEDPIQREVAQAINRQGPRRKAQFIVNAIAHYIHCPETPTVSSAGAAAPDHAAIESVILQVLADFFQLGVDAAAYGSGHGQPQHGLRLQNRYIDHADLNRQAGEVFFQPDPFLFLGPGGDPRQARRAQRAGQSPEQGALAAAPVPSEDQVAFTAAAERTQHTAHG